jgi:hypothetical protein
MCAVFRVMPELSAGGGIVGLLDEVDVGSARLQPGGVAFKAFGQAAQDAVDMTAARYRDAGGAPT